MVLVIVSAIIFQLAAALLSFRLIRLTGRAVAWSLVSAGLLLMALRRLFSLSLIMGGHSLGQLEHWNEITGLVISMLMFSGIAGIAPVFRAIRESETRWRNGQQLLENILNSIPQAVFWKDLAGIYLGCNRLFADKLGVGSPREVLGRNDRELGAISSAPIGKLAATLDNPDLTRLHAMNSIEDASGTQWIDVSQVPLTTAEGQHCGLIGIFEDVTQRINSAEEIKKLEDHLHQVQKMESIGTLAGGIAHDFNNILTSMIGFTELAQLKQTANQPIDHELSQALKACLRARDLIRQILTFSRQAVIRREPLRLHEQLEEIMKLIRATLPATIEIDQGLTIDSDALVMADATQLHQILMNLCTNAAQAMPGGGRLEIRLEAVQLSDEALLSLKDLAPGIYYRLSVSDSGCGMAPEVSAKVFEPFFTTKPPGEGTGMGLSVVHGIVKDMGGAISVYSEPGRGTTFNLLLPQLNAQSGVADHEPNRLTPGQGRILFVDDEEDIVSACRGILEGLGYRVDATSNPLEALDIFGASPLAYDCVLTDMTMPKMTGLELSEQISRIRPDVPIILCTGFSMGLNGSTIQSAGIRQLLVKPMIASELSATVHRVIHADSPRQH